jgi:hypothetical protein
MNKKLSDQFEMAIRKYSKTPELRRGQTYMLALNDVDPDAYKKITNTESDCFSDDNNIPRFYIKLSELWG